MNAPHTPAPVAACTMRTRRTEAVWSSIDPTYIVYFEDDGTREQWLADAKADLAALFRQRQALAQALDNALQQYDQMRRTIGGPHLPFITEAEALLKELRAEPGRPIATAGGV